MRVESLETGYILHPLGKVYVRKASDSWLTPNSQDIQDPISEKKQKTVRAGQADPDYPSGCPFPGPAWVRQLTTPIHLLVW